MAARQVRAGTRTRIDAAAAAWERSGDARALEGLAAALLAGRRTQAAIDLLGAHPGQVASDPDVMRLWAVALRKARRWAEAAEAFERLARAMQAAGRGTGGGAGGGQVGADVGGGGGRGAAGLGAGAGRQGLDRGGSGREAAAVRVGRSDSTAGMSGVGGPEAAGLPTAAGMGGGGGRSGKGPRTGADWALAEAIDCRLQGRGAAEAADEVRRLLLLPSMAGNPYARALHGRLLMKAGDAAAAVGPLLEATAALPADGSVAAAAAFAVRRVEGAGAGLPLLVRALRIRADQPAVLAAAVADAVRLRRVAATRRVLIELARAAPNPGPVWNAVRRLGAARADGGGGVPHGRERAGRRPGSGSGPAGG